MSELRDQAELDLLAEELRRACPAPDLSDAFAEELRARLAAHPWTLSSALRRNSLIRVAAMLLVLSTVAGPVAALVLLFRAPPKHVAEIIWTIPQPQPEVEEGPDHQPLPAVPPVDPAAGNAFGLDWQEALTRENRMALIVRQWHDAGLASGQAAAAPSRLDWSDAGRADLEAEFLRRCELGILASPSPGMVQRVRSFEPEAGRAAQNQDAGTASAVDAWLAAWQWVLDRDASEQPEDPPIFFGTGF